MACKGLKIGGHQLMNIILVIIDKPISKLNHVLCYIAFQVDLRYKK